MADDFSELVKKAPPFLQPKLNLFLSVDIVGSTAYKQTSRVRKAGEDLPPVEQWVIMVTHFYRDFSTAFLTECQKFEQLYKGGWNGGWVEPGKPHLWKAAGDELIYCVKLLDHRHAALFVSAWVAAIKIVRPVLSTYSHKLNLKACAWLAGFPVNNTEVMLEVGKPTGVSLAGSHNTAANENMLNLHYHYLPAEKSQNGSMVVDYIGPSLDIGFRLGGYATPRRFICSVELAWLICQALKDKTVRSVRDLAENCKDNASVFHISERQLLKGVLDGVPYPIIWIDIGEHKNFNEVEDKVFANAPLQSETVMEYCEAFIKSCDVDYLILPFIKDEPNTSPSDSYTQKYGKLLAHWGNVLKDHEDAMPKNTDTVIQKELPSGKTGELLMAFFKAITDSQKPPH